MKRIVWIVVAVLVAAGAGAWWALSSGGDGGAASSAEGRRPGTEPPSAGSVTRSPGRSGTEGGAPASDDRSGEDADSRQPDAAGEEEPLTEEEKAAAEAEAKVEAFDGLTDKWMEPAKSGVTMADVDAFVAAFRKVPKDRRDECIHRALNLVPDENVMLLAGVLMDKTMDKETVETVFNDVLNRDEEVKKPILRQIFKDKTHACWADTAWILDVTGETPSK